MKKSLNFKKETIASLNNADLNQIEGGNGTRFCDWEPGSVIHVCLSSPGMKNGCQSFYSEVEACYTYAKM
ncbi:MAG: class I lanthipeptide [Hyphomicrobiales bacterium]